MLGLSQLQMAEHPTQTSFNKKVRLIGLHTRNRQIENLLQAQPEEGHTGARPLPPDSASLCSPHCWHLSQAGSTHVMENSRWQLSVYIWPISKPSRRILDHRRHILGFYLGLLESRAHSCRILGHTYKVLRM